MSGTKALIDCVEIDLGTDDDKLTVYIDVFQSSLSRRWLTALNQLLINNYHLEKNYCFFGFIESKRNIEYICNQINQSIMTINNTELGYHIDDYFSPENTIQSGPVGTHSPGLCLIHDKMNQLHRYFEDLQGVSGNMSRYYDQADAVTRWHIRQLNLLCHEYESLVLSLRKAQHAPEWRRPSQLMCWLNAPRFELEPDDYELFGIETINRPLGGVTVGVNKAVGKHHWEVFNDEGRDSRIDELTTTTLRNQTEAAGDFDIEWGNNPGEFEFQKRKLSAFRDWLTVNGIDPEDKSLTIGHPQVGQVNLTRSFGTTDYQEIWVKLGTHLNVLAIRTSSASAEYKYCWSDSDFVNLQVQRISQGN